jgi:hypothetical protein
LETVGLPGDRSTCPGLAASAQHKQWSRIPPTMAAHRRKIPTPSMEHSQGRRRSVGGRIPSPLPPTRQRGFLGDQHVGSPTGSTDRTLEPTPFAESEPADHPTDAVAPRIKCPGTDRAGRRPGSPGRRDGALVGTSNEHRDALPYQKGPFVTRRKIWREALARSDRAHAAIYWPDPAIRRRPQRAQRRRDYPVELTLDDATVLFPYRPP